MSLSASNFREPLLRILAEMSEYTAGVAVKGTDTYDNVMALMGIADKDEHGVNKASGQPMVFKWIQWANTSLREKGMTENAGRGKWALTAAGLTASVKLQTAAGIKVPTATAAATQDPAHVAASSTVTALPTTTGVSIAIGTVAARTSLYSGDAYVRSLGIAGTPCFGKFSPHGSAVCTDCPLQHECRNQQAARLSKLADLLAREDRAANAPKAPKATQAAFAAKATQAAKAAKTAAPAFDASKIDFSTADVIRCRMAMGCEACGQEVKVGDKCRWVESINDNDDAGVFHLDCSGGQP